MSGTGAWSRWRFVFAPRWLAWHAFTVAAIVGMLWLGDWQFHRAEGGNALSWAYTFEWPVFAAFGLVFWAKTIIDEGKPKTVAAAPAAGEFQVPGDDGLPVTVRRPVPVPDDGADDDPELDEYNAYLAQLGRRAQGSGGRPGPR
ncbi:MAG TPA: hypothetical protein VGG25_12940 [Streptosporangiaceae bacterium]|jgi:hypothetical protein